MEGVKELDDPHVEEITPKSRMRKAGAGRKPVREEQTGILESRENLVSAHPKGDPMSALFWTNKRLRNLEMGRLGLGYTACYRVVGIMLKRLGYGLQADQKPPVTPPHKDRDAQFEHSNEECKKATAKGAAILSIDAKKKEKRRKWWYAEGIRAYAGAPEVVLTADCGGSNGYRNCLWKRELQNFANERR
jgi:hypothetical protein